MTCFREENIEFQMEAASFCLIVNATVISCKYSKILVKINS